MVSRYHARDARSFVDILRNLDRLPRLARIFLLTLEKNAMLLTLFNTASVFTKVGQKLGECRVTYRVGS